MWYRGFLTCNEMKDFFSKNVNKIAQEKSRKLQKTIIMEEMQRVKKDLSLLKASGLKSFLSECLKLSKTFSSYINSPKRWKWTES